MTEDEAALRAAAIENHRRWFQRLAGGRAVPVGGGSQLHPTPSGAMVVATPGLDVAGLATEVRQLGVDDVGYWSRDPDGGLGAHLLGRGFRWEWRPHWMARDLLADPPRSGADRSTPTRLRIGPADPPHARTLPFAPTGPVPAPAVRIGARLREKVIGTVTVNPDGEVAGLYDTGVVPGVRRRGIGTALVEAAASVAVDAGCRRLVLNATDEGALLSLGRVEPAASLRAAGASD